MMETSRRCAFGVAAVLAWSIVCSSAAVAEVFTVTTSCDPACPATLPNACTADGMTSGSLRWAITQANQATGVSTIAFNIPGTGPRKIAPCTTLLPPPVGPVSICTATHNTARPLALPNIVRPVILDGSTQAACVKPNGAKYHCKPSGGDGEHYIELSGENLPLLPAFADGNTLCVNELHLIAANDGSSAPDGSVIRGLVINRSGRNAILVDGTSNVTIVGNIIGLAYDANGDLVGPSTLGPPTPNNYPYPLGNGRVGIFVEQTQVCPPGAACFLRPSNGTVIGTASPGDRNIVSGNNYIGIDLDPGASNSVVQGNWIGTDLSGIKGPGNSYIGLLLGDTGNLIGGSNAGEGNVIYGSGFWGTPGSIPSPTSFPQNFAGGIRLFTATYNVVEGNYISGNSASGINVAPSASHNVIRENYIAGGDGPVSHNCGVPGPASCRNDWGGISVFGNQTIIESNIIKGNGAPLTDGPLSIGPLGPGNPAAPRQSAGIVVMDEGVTAGFAPAAVTGNTILSNSISGNFGLGIDIVRSVNPLAVSADGPNLNAPYDPASGPAAPVCPQPAGPPYASPPNPQATGCQLPNHLQNYPVLARAIRIGEHKLHLEGSLSSAPATQFRIQIFSGDSANTYQVATASGMVPFLAAQGENLISDLTIFTNAAGEADFSLDLKTHHEREDCDDRFVTATATNLSTGDTSEFSEAVELR